MSLPLNLEDTLNFMAQLKSGTLIGAWNCYIRQGTAYINSWNDTIAGMTQPTDQEIIDAGNDLTVVNGQVFSVWFAENGGDPVLTNRRVATEDGIDGDRAISVQSRAELGERNTRDNYLVTRIIELQDALLAIKASTGAADNIRAAIPASFSPSATKDRATARQDLKDEINSGGSDT